jgi:hypothetical protein
MTRLVIEQGQAARSIATPVRSGKPAVAASVRAFNQRGKGRLGRDLLSGICRLWQPREDHGHESPLAGTFYSVPTLPTSVVALG